MGRDDHREKVPPTAAPFLKQLEDLQDVRIGLPVTSHRSGLIGPSLVTAKKLFRVAFQPFINELMRKQAQFNESLIALTYAMYRDLRSTESAMQAMGAGLQARIRKLEEAVARLEAQNTAGEREELGATVRNSRNVEDAN